MNRASELRNPSRVVERNDGGEKRRRNKYNRKTRRSNSAFANLSSPSTRLERVIRLTRDARRAAHARSIVLRARDSSSRNTLLRNAQSIALLTPR